MTGADTTNNQMEWVILCVANFPQVQERLREEIIEAFGRQDTPVLADIDKVPYVEAFLMEVR